MAEEEQQSQENLEELSLKNEALQERIDALQRELIEAPEKLRLEAEERSLTLPPPDEISHVRRERSFFERMSRGELRNEQKHQVKNGLLFLLLVLAIIAIALWIYRYLNPLI